MHFIFKIKYKNCIKGNKMHIYAIVVNCNYWFFKFIIMQK